MSFPSLHRLMCALLLVAYTAMGTPLVAALVVVVAEWDGGHSVSISFSDRGTEVVLNHEKEMFTPKRNDHASSLLRAVVSLGQNDTNGDHLIVTNQVSSLSKPSQETETVDTKTLDPQVEIDATLLTLNPHFSRTSEDGQLRWSGPIEVPWFRDLMRSSIATVQLVV